MSCDDNDWTELRPALPDIELRGVFLRSVQEFVDASKGPDSETATEDLRDAFIQEIKAGGHPDRQALLASVLVVADLLQQGWQVRVRGQTVSLRPPAELSEDPGAEKVRIRRQEMLKRDAQLQEPAVRKFIAAIERPRFFNGKLVSIFSVMRDGRELAARLRSAREVVENGYIHELAGVIDPYLSFVTEEAMCPLTGLRLMDVWRYFRHTWSNQYTSVPGRTMAFLVRDRAADFHPIIGIGALSSPVMQIAERDSWIGWHPDVFLTHAQANPTTALAQWLVGVAETAISEIYIEDFIESGFFSAVNLRDPSPELINRLLEESAEQRLLHHRYVRSRDHKRARPAVVTDDYWIAQARTHLFRSKRALALASYLRARAALRVAFGNEPTGEKLGEFAVTAQGSDVLRRLVKKAKADRVGISVADITVCGAVQPYNAILGGKLVAMLATSPEVVLEYRRRYASAESEIASSVAGRSVIRAPTLVFLGTTSLYGVGSSQYNRIGIPCERLGGSPTDAIRYTELGHSRAFGTSQYSQATVDALIDVIQQSGDGQRVNSIFGEGISPKLRKIRQALDLLGLPSDLLLRHHRRRVVYAIGLIRNLREYLLGMDSEPEYKYSTVDGEAATARIAEWWRERWLSNRIRSDDALSAVEAHTLIRPIRHGARVYSPPSKQQMLFPESSR